MKKRLTAIIIGLLLMVGTVFASIDKPTNMDEMIQNLSRSEFIMEVYQNGNSVYVKVDNPVDGVCDWGAYLEWSGQLNEDGEMLVSILNGLECIDPGEGFTLVYKKK